MLEACSPEYMDFRTRPAERREDIPLSGIIFKVDSVCSVCFDQKAVDKV